MAAQPAVRTDYPTIPGSAITLVISGMAITQSKVTVQGQITVPKAIRTKLGIGPGSILNWEEDGDKVFVSRAFRFSSSDIHRAVFGQTTSRHRRPKVHSTSELKEGIRQYVRKRYGQR